MQRDAPTSERLLGPNGQLSDGANRFAQKCSEFSPAGKRHVVRKLKERAGLPEDEVDVHCIVSLRRFYKETGSQSATSYQTYINGIPRPHDFASVTKIRKTLGGPQRSWAEVRGRVFGSGSANPIASRAVFRQAMRCSRERILEIVQMSRAG